MKTLISITFLFLLGLSSCSTESNSTEITIDNLSSRSLKKKKSKRSSAPMMKVSFVDGCITVLSSNKVSNIVMQTGKGEVKLSKINKRSGVFCAPNDSEIISVVINSANSKGKEYSKQFDAVAMN